MSEILSTISYLESKGFLQPDFTRDEYHGRIVCILDPSLSQSLMQEQEIQEVPDFFRFDSAHIVQILPQLGGNISKGDSSHSEKNLQFSAYKIEENGISKKIVGKNNQTKFQTLSKGFPSNYIDGLFLKQSDVDRAQNKQVHDVLVSWGYEFVPYPEGKHIHGYHGPMCYIFPKYIAKRFAEKLKIDDTPVIVQIRRGSLVELGGSINRHQPYNKILYNLFALKDNGGHIIPQPISWKQHKDSTQDTIKTTLKIEGRTAFLETREGVYILKKHLQKYKSI